MARRVLLAVVLFLTAWSWAAELTPAVHADDLDLARCGAFEGARALGVPTAETLGALLGLAPADPLPTWSTGPVPGRDRYFRIAFTHPIALGTLCTTYTGGRSADTLFQLGSGTAVALLKSDAAYPGDVTQDDDWLILPPGAVKTLPPGTVTRALRFADRRIQLPWANLEWGMEASEMGVTLLFRERYADALTLGNAKSGYTEKGQESWTAFWPEERPLAGVVNLAAKSVAARVQALKTGTAEHPTLALAAAWSKVADAPAGGPRALAFDAPAATRGVRLVAALAGTKNTLTGVIPLLPLGDGPIPSTKLPVAPYTFTYPMPQDGFIAINIDEKQTGAHIRRLIAETARLKGPVQEAWDLKDDNGAYVPPGAYAWHAITRPQLKLTYEGTVNNAGQPPWYAPVTGGGGWMADHCAPEAVCAVGDHLFMGTYGSEYGQAIIATDLNGHKVWAGGNTPADRVVTDGTYAYLVTPAGVTRVDPAHDFKMTRVADFSYTRDVPSVGTFYGNFDPDCGDAAVRGRDLFIAYNGVPLPWVQSTFTDDQVDLNRCLPMPRQEPAGFDMRNYTERQRFFAAFLTGSAPSSELAGWDGTPTNGALAGVYTVAFTKPMPVGSVLLADGAQKVYALKPGAALPGGNPDDMAPGDAGDEEDALDPTLWLLLDSPATPNQPVLAVAPKGGLLTTALRFKAPRISFSLVLNRRYTDIASTSTRVFTEGNEVGKHGWHAERPAKTPITADNPARLAWVWPTPVTLRGVTLVAPTHYGLTAVDVWIGPDDGDPKASLADDSQWRQAGYIQPRENYLNSPRTPTAANVDFGEVCTTRAVRMRVVAPDGARGFGNPIITGPHIASVGNLIAYSPLGDDTPLPPALNARLTQVTLPAPGDTGKGTVVRHVPVPRPTGLAVGPDGALYVASDRRVIAYPGADLTAAPREIIPAGGLVAPRMMAFDAAGLLYIVDAGPKQVKVFDPKTGKLVRALGTAGGAQLGPFDPTRLDEPVGLTIDRAGKVWVAEGSYQPKRVLRWNADGTLEKEFYGPTTYGGGGHMDPGDKSVINFCGMKFRMDWATRQWKLESRIWRPGLGASMASGAPDRVIYYQNRRYLAGDLDMTAFSDRPAVAVISIERNGVAVPIAAAGNLAAWSAVATTPELRAAYAKLDRTAIGFVWSDLNGDGLPQLAEVQTTPAQAMKNVNGIGEDLTFTFRVPGLRLRPTAIRPDGVPTYDMAKLEVSPPLDNYTLPLADGRTFIMANGLLAPDAKTWQWSYPDNYASVQLSNANPWGFANRPPGVLIGELRIMGHMTVGGEELFVTNGNHGDWYAFTRDGLLAAAIFGGPVGYGQRWWSMPEWIPGKTDLTDLRLTVEDFYGSICKADDGNVYAIAGKNHVSIVRVDGLAAMQRLNGACTVSVADLDAAKAWEVRRAALERARREPKIAHFAYTDKAPAIDGSLDDWPEAAFLTITEVRNEQGQVIKFSKAAVAFDDEKLYIAGTASDTSPLVNSALDLQRLFQYGDALEVNLGGDPKADPARTVPAPGDLRLLLARVKDANVAIAYHYHVPGAPAAERVTFTSPVGKETVDRIDLLKDAEISVTADAEKHVWTIEAAIPWKSLGLTRPQLGETWRGDVGVLESDPDGTATVRRTYWANTGQVILGDLPSEARVTPALWGELRAVEAGDALRFGGPDAGAAAEP